MGIEIIDFKATKCKHCYKCVRYCEVKAIQVKDERAVIMPDKCILCGHCLKICPQSAKTLKSDLDLVKGFIARGGPGVVSIAPAYMGLLKYKTIGQVRSALIRLGFEDVRETSEGAAFVTAEYARLLEEHTMENIITTCCPSVNDLVEIYYPDLVPYLAPVVSPDDCSRQAAQGGAGERRQGGILGSLHCEEKGNLWMCAIRDLLMQC